MNCISFDNSVFRVMHVTFLTMACIAMSNETVLSIDHFISKGVDNGRGMAQHRLDDTIKLALSQIAVSCPEYKSLSDDNRKLIHSQVRLALAGELLVYASQNLIKKPEVAIPKKKKKEKKKEKNCTLIKSRALWILE